MAYPKPILPLNDNEAERFLEQLEEFEASEEQLAEIQDIRRQMRANPKKRE